jgi:hypothetical protein
MLKWTFWVYFMPVTGEIQSCLLVVLPLLVIRFLAVFDAVVPSVP